MSLNCLEAICCDEESVTSFSQICGDQVKFDSSIAAVAIVENDSFPEVGDTVTLSNSETPVVLTECNYIDSLLTWVRDKQYACEGGGKYYHFLPNGLLAKATRAKATSKRSENGSNYFGKKYLGYDTTAELFLEEHYLPNSEVICGIQTRASSLSVIYFFKQGGLVLDNDNDYNISISEAGFEVNGNKNEYVMGSITLEESGKCQPAPYYAADPKAFIKELKKKTAFTFDTTVISVALTEQACGSRGSCAAYAVDAADAFTITPVVNELVSCGTFTLFQNCNDEVGEDVDISINSSTGVVTSTGLDAGSYKFTVLVTNDCGISGSLCFTIIAA